MTNNQIKSYDVDRYELFSSLLDDTIVKGVTINRTNSSSRNIMMFMGIVAKERNLIIVL